ncbi:MAG: hypothetical protein M9962_03075 [Oligoflexia bacterium]|nr:hypothetical protein [Oligoflexia bacterium]
MKFLLVTFLTALYTLPSYAFDQIRCAKPEANEPYVTMNEFRWKQTLPEMAQNFKTFYESDKRLAGRAYVEEETKKMIISEPYGRIELDDIFIKSITRHIEISLQRRYADFVFFSDMGHSHLYLPQEDWKKISPTKERNLLYQKLFQLRSLKILYHTAEQLLIRGGDNGMGDYPQDKELLWRYFSRNPVGDNNGGESVAPYFAFDQNYNTVGSLPEGYFLYSAGFYIHASKNGCFAYNHKGETKYFDIALDLPYQSNPGNGDEWNFISGFIKHFADKF